MLFNCTQPCFTICFNAGDPTFWLSGTNNNSLSDYVWATNGNRIDNARWARHRPITYATNCVYLDDNYKLSSKFCDMNDYFICQISPCDPPLPTTRRPAPIPTTIQPVTTTTVPAPTTTTTTTTEPAPTTTTTTTTEPAPTTTTTTTTEPPSTPPPA